MSIAKAEAEMRELREKVEGYQVFIAKAQARIADLITYIRIAGELGDPDVSAGREPALTSAVSRESSRSREDGKSARARSMSVEAVTETGRAMHTRDLIELLTPHGLTFGRGDPKSATGDLSSILGREPLLRNAGRSVGWVLAEWEGAHSAAEADRRRRAATDPISTPSHEAVDVPGDEAPASTEDASPPDRELPPSSDVGTTTRQAAE